MTENSLDSLESWKLRKFLEKSSRIVTHFSYFSSNFNSNKMQSINFHKKTVVQFLQKIKYKLFYLWTCFNNAIMWDKVKEKTLIFEVFSSVSKNRVFGIFSTFDWKNKLSKISNIFLPDDLSFKVFFGFFQIFLQISRKLP